MTEAHDERYVLAVERMARAMEDRVEVEKKKLATLALIATHLGNAVASLATLSKKSIFEQVFGK